MAEIAAVIASTHHPFYYRASTSTGADRPPFADEWVAKIERFRETQRSTKLDGLTGLFNHTAAKSRLKVMASRLTPGSQLTVAMLDIDHFKQFNDRFGHMVGDRVLGLVGKQLNAAARVGVSVYRYGGEEFALIFCGGGFEQAVQFVENLRTTIGNLVLRDTRSGERLSGITVSIGIAARHRGETAEQLLGRADTALYRAKESGRNRVCSAS